MVENREMDEQDFISLLQEFWPAETKTTPIISPSSIS